ncbi:hypothetical protein B0H13DRAFT_1896140 [Mycena leptocephala]|nr:hypothetical protein B0H13DRAFT_1896140 [Mycena leptocephala]
MKRLFLCVCVCVCVCVVVVVVESSGKFRIGKDGTQDGQTRTQEQLGSCQKETQSYPNESRAPKAVGSCKDRNPGFGLIGGGGGGEWIYLRSENNEYENILQIVNMGLGPAHDLGCR